MRDKVGKCEYMHEKGVCLSNIAYYDTQNPQRALKSVASGTIMASAAAFIISNRALKAFDASGESSSLSCL